MSFSKRGISPKLEVLKLIGSPDSQAELDDLRNSLHTVSCRTTRPCSNDFTDTSATESQFFAMAIGAFNQLSGINAILYYLPTIFAAAGYSRVSGTSRRRDWCHEPHCTLLGMALIDKVGRKMLLLIGAIGNAVSLGTVAAIFASKSCNENSRLF